MQNRDIPAILSKRSAAVFSRKFSRLLKLYFSIIQAVWKVWRLAINFLYILFFSVQKVYITFHNSIVIFKRLQAK